MADHGLLTVAVWAVLNIGMVAFVTYAARTKLDELGLSAILVLNAIIVLRSAPYWPRWMQPQPKRDDEL